MKKIIVLFGHKAVVEAAKDAGLYVVNILERNMLHSTFLKASGIADETIVLGSLDDLERVVCKQLDGNETLGVVSFTDTRSGVERAATFSEKYLSQNSFVSPDAVDTLMNKKRARNYFRSIGQPEVENIVPRSVAEITNFVSQHGRSILKPVSGQASEDITLIDSVSNIDALVATRKEKIERGAYILEEFIEGSEYSVESLTANGHTLILGITEKSKIPHGLPHCEFVEMGHTFPAQLPEVLEKRICKTVLSVFNSMNIATGLGHTEVILKDGEPFVVESHLRAGGDCITDLIELVTGYSPYYLFFLGLAGNGIPQIQHRESASIKYYIPERTGQICDAQFYPDGRKYNSTIKDRVDFSEKLITPIMSSFDRKWGYAIAWGTNAKEAVSSYLDQYKLSLENESEENLSDEKKR